MPTTKNIFTHNIEEVNGNPADFQEAIIDDLMESMELYVPPKGSFQFSNAEEPKPLEPVFHVPAVPIYDYECLPI